MFPPKNPNQENFTHLFHCERHADAVLLHQHCSRVKGDGSSWIAVWNAAAQRNPKITKSPLTSASATPPAAVPQCPDRSVRTDSKSRSTRGSVRAPNNPTPAAVTCPFHRTCAVPEGFKLRGNKTPTKSVPEDAQFQSNNLLVELVLKQKQRFCIKTAFLLNPPRAAHEQRCATVRRACVSEGAAGAQRRCRKRGCDHETCSDLEITMNYCFKATLLVNNDLK